MSIVIRPAAAADLPALHALIERAYRGDAARAGWTHEADLLAGPRTTLAALAAIVADPARAMLIAVEDGVIAAGVEVTVDGALGYLGQLAVEPVRQAGGLGRMMIMAAEARALAAGATRIELTVVDRRAELIAYYQRRGYAPTGEVRPFPFERPKSGPPLTLVVLDRTLAG